MIENPSCIIHKRAKCNKENVSLCIVRLSYATVSLIKETLNKLFTGDWYEIF